MPFQSNQEFYAFIERLIARLDALGLPVPSAQLETALRAGCTSGEILTDLGVTLTRIRNEYADRLPKDVHKDVKTALAAINKALRMW